MSSIAVSLADRHNGDTDESKYLRKVAHLMLQAERAATPEEAQAFAERAQKLRTKHSIDEAVARAKITAIEARAIPVQRQIVIGSRGTKGLRTYVELFLAISRANDVQCDIAHDSTVVYAFGFEADIDACELIYGHLLIQMVTASNDYLRSGAYKSETVRVPVYRQGEVITYTYRGARRRRILVGYEDKPVKGVTARQSFQRAFAHAVGARLRQAREYAINEAEDARQAERAALPPELTLVREASLAEHAPSEETAVVLAAKEVEVRDYYKQNSEAKGSWRGFRANNPTAAKSARAGAKAGQNASLGVHREIAS